MSGCSGKRSPSYPYANLQPLLHPPCKDLPMALEFSNLPRDLLPSMPTSTAPALPGELLTMPLCQVLVLWHQKSWEVYLPSIHRRETLQETPSYAQVRTAAIGVCKPSHTTTISLVRTPHGASEGQACHSLQVSSHGDSCSLLLWGFWVISLVSEQQ